MRGLLRRPSTVTGWLALCAVYLALLLSPTISPIGYSLCDAAYMPSLGENRCRSDSHTKPLKHKEGPAILNPYLCGLVALCEILSGCRLFQNERRASQFGTIRDSRNRRSSRRRGTMSVKKDRKERKNAIACSSGCYYKMNPVRIPKPGRPFSLFASASKTG
jgi:hypothetical protein